MILQGVNMLNENELKEVKEIATLLNLKIDFIDQFNLILVGKQVIDFEITFDMDYHKVFKYVASATYNKNEESKNELRIKFKKRL